MTPRQETLHAYYKKVANAYEKQPENKKNKSEIARKFHTSRQRIQQILDKMYAK